MLLTVSSCVNESKRAPAAQGVLTAGPREYSRACLRRRYSGDAAWVEWWQAAIVCQVRIWIFCNVYEGALSPSPSKTNFWPAEEEVSCFLLRFTAFAVFLYFELQGRRDLRLTCHKSSGALGNTYTSLALSLSLSLSLSFSRRSDDIV